ncbi:hypothetical protein L226DRAFT_106684 [Lentinus tigrinus ALCF2SS1-7]|uniref:Uncharacterized protein n=1 Tax=Lentinus tigrinus ALCF2SS1-6 TaxID=1328759 RepID=A0A5C2S5K3_9APHY|nr:hypothetical protein L227DRAFT_172772 [Lentinus tigrinus ALCF2SS1-6]RPD73262.1 hypothetical protein L226DRAFT_106684 [Lentinus tigrinus ALCF2SS1-7]
MPPLQLRVSFRVVRSFICITSGTALPPSPSSTLPDRSTRHASRPAGRAATTRSSRVPAPCPGVSVRRSTALEEDLSFI